ncbi:MAG TPA: immunoglobulin domain-containing protein [Opitutus sp.]|nr:immunoglobulin domain-containing protein [Opitutus sp.]
MKKHFSIALLALVGLALPAGAATVQADLNDLVLGFRATSGTGQTLNLEVNLGSVALYTHPSGSPMTIARLSAADLSSTYGANWNSRSDLFWGVIGSSGRTGSGGPDGQSLVTLWASRPETTVGTQSAAFNRGSRNAQSFASSVVESVYRAAPGSLDGATSTGNSSYSAKINATLTGSFTVQDTNTAGVSFGFFNPTIDNGVVSSGWAVSDLYELQPGSGTATYIGSFGLSSDGTLKFATSPAAFTGTPAPEVTQQPESQSAAPGAAISLTVAASGSPTYQWEHNGDDVAGGTGSTLNLASLGTADAGIYAAKLHNDGGDLFSDPAIVGLSISTKFLGTGSAEIGTDIHHPNGNIYDQVSLASASAAFTADPNQVTRMSYIDLNDDIVQVEFSGAGTVSIVLDAATGPANPVNYNQTFPYMKGHAGIVITGANETSNLLVFTVGKVTAVNQALFKDDVTYDGIADLSFVAISSTNGKFGGLRLSDAALWSDKGVVGIYAPGVDFLGPVYVGDIDAMGDATPYLVIGSIANASRVGITGGNLHQDNARPVHIAGFSQLHFQAGTKSDGTLLQSQSVDGVLVNNAGSDVTSTVALPPE